MADLDAQAKRDDGQPYGKTRHSFHRAEQSAGKAEAVEKTEKESDQEPAGAAALLRHDHVLKRDENDAGRDHRLDDIRRQPDDVQHRERERDRVGEYEGADDSYQIPQRRYRQRERGDEEQMIVTRENMHDAVADVFLRHARPVEPRRRAARE